MINNVSLTGRLTRDPELKYTNGSNTPVLSFTLVYVKSFSFLEAKKNQAPSSGQPAAASYAPVTDVPF